MDLNVGTSSAENTAGNALAGERLTDRVLIGRRDFDKHAKFFRKQAVGRRGTELFRIDLQVHATVSGKTHFQSADNQPAVANVVVGENGLTLLDNQLLENIKSILKHLGVVHIRALPANLVEHLGEVAGPYSSFAVRNIHVNDRALPGLLELRRLRNRDVRGRRVPGHHQCPRRLGEFGVAILRGHSRRHRQAILPAVDSAAHLDHDVPQGLHGVINRRALAGKLRGPHPIRLGLDVVDRADAGRGDVGQHLAKGHARHGLGREHGEQRPLADGARAPGGREVALGDDGRVGQGELKRAHALLLGDQASHGTIHLGGEEPLRADRPDAKNQVESVGHGNVEVEGQ
mmetsp:Transcript_16205/g.41695  ORF Transcript_16205/g.41695 Transcript_16205/m.41695 type:complete len:345 (-) Transcript_16205:345-1379(-)